MPTTFTIKEVFIPLGNIKIKPKNKNATTSITLREFQEEVIRKLKDHRVLGVSAPTGAGKTFLVLAPLLSNIIYKLQKPFTGVVGIYPTKPLVNDQFLSIISILDRLCLREDEPKDPDGRNVYVRYFCHVELEDGVLGLTEEIKTTVGIVRLTSDVLKKLRDTLVKQGYEKRELSANITLLDLIKQHILNAEYLVVITVPEYLYMLLTGMYRNEFDAQRFLSLVAEGTFVYDLAKEIIKMSNNEVALKLQRFKKVLTQQLLHGKSAERQKLNIYSALFSEVMFLDEFHAWSFYEKPALLSLLLIYYFEYSFTGRNWRLILSSATPQEEFYKLLKEFGLDVEAITARVTDASHNAHKVRSKVIVEIVPIESGYQRGSIAWLKIEDSLPELVKTYSDKISRYGRAIIFSRRNSTVEECARLFYEITGKTPTVVTGVEPPSFAKGKDELEVKKDYGELYIFGNYSVELGVDLKNMPCGIIYGSYLGEFIQRLGRIGRGDVEEAWVVIPVPKYYEDQLKVLEGMEITYEDFIKKFSEVIEPKLGVEIYGEQFIWDHKLGKIRMYIPLASYLLYQVALWEYSEAVKRLCEKFLSVIDKLNMTKELKWLFKIQKSADVLLPLAAFRLSPSVRYKREGVEDEASLSTLLGNYCVEYKDNKLIVKEVCKKSLPDVLTLKVHSLNVFRNTYDLILDSKLLFQLIDRETEKEKREKGEVRKSEGNDVLLRILMHYGMPVYVAKPYHGYDDIYEILHAFGYAIKVESVYADHTTGKPLSIYLLLL